LGIDVPRTAEAQQAACKAVKPRNRKPGDLIFFQGTYKPGVSHVGIYIGDDMMIHAPGTGDVVKYTNITSDYYKRHFHSYGRA
jgi:cell wall-associated NlpC family hydrolase